MNDLRARGLVSKGGRVQIPVPKSGRVGHRCGHRVAVRWVPQPLLGQLQEYARGRAAESQG